MSGRASFSLHHFLVAPPWVWWYLLGNATCVMAGTLQLPGGVLKICGFRENGDDSPQSALPSNLEVAQMAHILSFLKQTGRNQKRKCVEFWLWDMIPVRKRETLYMLVCYLGEFLLGLLMTRVDVEISGVPPSQVDSFSIMVAQDLSIPESLNSENTRNEAMKRTLW